MASNYTPQAGDVWSHPTGVVWRLVATKGVMLRADLLVNKGQENERWLEGIARCIPARLERRFAKNGWTLVHREGHDAVFNGIPFNWDRKEVQDGK